ncbi:unnamed protein product [Orchesella dallaii]|uniref:Ionotropic glutamate receptor C-terminal domain-containing protein n=1 Tax=Orchesella dallaii TaxID=48710 RepID=A0ABP1R8P1_9HEXA
MAFGAHFLILCTSFQVGFCLIPKEYFGTLLSNYFFKGYDLIVSVKKESEDNLLSWLKESNHSVFSVTLAGSKLSNTLESVRNISRRIEQIAMIIEFRNISHLETQLQVKRFYTRTELPQPVYFIITPSPAVYTALQHDENGLGRIAREFSINADLYLFGQELTANQIKKKKRNRIMLSDYQSQGFVGDPFPNDFGLTELYSLKNITFLEPVDMTETNVLQKVIRRNDFRSAPITAVAQYAYAGRAGFTSDNSSYTTGYEIDQLQYLASSFNFTIVPKMGAGWITLTEDKRLTGMGEQLINKEADISISSSEMLVYRAAQLTFLHPTYYATIWGFFKQPDTNSIRDIFINAFTLDLWLTMFATWFLIIVAMCALAIVKWKLGTLHENDKIVMQEVFIWAAGAICQQGWHVCPESGCMKIVFIFALITGLVSYVGYSAALVSILSVKVVPIQSLSDLVSYRYTIYQDNQTISTNHIIHDLESSGIISSLPHDQRTLKSDEALKKLMSSKSAFLGVSDLFYPSVRNHLCTDLKICKQIQKISVSKNRPVQGGMFVRKRSSFSDFFNHRILLMHERGLRYRLLENYFRATGVMCLDLSASEKEPLGLNDVVTAYVILLLGYLLSLTVFVIEKMCATSLTNNANDDVYNYAIPNKQYYIT